MTASNKLVPNEIIVAPDSYTGAASAWQATNADLDTSYVTEDASDAEFGLTTQSLPAYAMVKSVQLYCRHRSVTAAAGFYMSLTIDGVRVGPALARTAGDVSVGSFTPHATNHTEPGPWWGTGAVHGPITSEKIGRLRLRYRSLDGTYDGQWSYMWAQLRWVVRPVCTATVQTDPWTQSTTPDVVWTRTLDVDGGAQTRYHLRVFDETTYGVGFVGVDPETDTPYYDSGEQVGSASQFTLGHLENGDTYQVHLRIAQSVLGETHWSAWDYDDFTVTVTTSDVDTVTATANNANARIDVAVARDTLSQAWDYIEVQRSIDAGTTWTDVRGSTYVDCTSDADDYTASDYEVPNGTTALYRARATRLVSSYPVTGSWVQSTPAVSWTSTDVWLKVPESTSDNQTVSLRRAIPWGRPARRGVFDVLGAAYPVVVADTRGAARSTIALAASTISETDTIVDLLADYDVILLQTPSDQSWGSRYVSIGSVSVAPVVVGTNRPHHTIELVDVVEVTAPADPLAGR